MDDSLAAKQRYETAAVAHASESDGLLHKLADEHAALQEQYAELLKQRMDLAGDAENLRAALAQETAKHKEMVAKRKRALCTACHDLFW